MKNITKTKVGGWALSLFLIAIMCTFGNFIGYGVTPDKTLPGMAVLWVIAFISLFLKQLIPTKLPTIVYTSIVGIILSVPYTPIANFINPLTNNIKLMAMVTPLLAYAGIVIGKDWGEFKKLGPKAVVVGIVVVFSSFLWAAVIAEILLKATGVI